MFGLNVAPEIFQRAVESVIGKCEGVRNLSDNIIVFGKDDEEHNARLEQVFQKLKSDNLTLNRNKCKFALKQIDFMGYIVSKGGIQLAEDKVRSIRDFVEPSTPTEVRSFLGLVNFCAKFIPKVAELTAPLRELTKKGTQFEWGKAHSKAFETLKTLIADSGSLVHFCKDRRTELIVDASPIGLGAVLTQEQPDGELSPVAYASKVLSDQETRYSQTEKEALAVIWACEKFHLYLYGSKFVIRTDHKPLEIIYAPHSRPSARIERWVLRLQQYQYDIKYVAGKDNIADSLSRLVKLPESGSSKQPSKTNRLETVAQEHINFVTMAALPKAMTLEEFQTATARDTQLEKVKLWLDTGKLHEECKPFYQIAHELSVHKGVLLRGTRIVVPRELRKRVLEIAHEAHQGIGKTKAMIRTKVWWPGFDRDISQMIKECVSCQIQGQGLRPEPLQMSAAPDKPWISLAMDICGPFYNGYYLIVLADYTSRWPEAMLTKSITSKTVIEWLKKVFACHGYPESITTDNGAQFVSREFTTYLEHCAVKHRRVTPYWPQANGLVERMNKVFLKAFRAAHSEGHSLHETLLVFLRVYRNTPHSSTNVKPSQLLLGREPRFNLPSFAVQSPSQLMTSAMTSDAKRKEKEKEFADVKRNAKKSDLKKGDLVFVKQHRTHKLTTRFDKTVCKVVSKDGNSLVLMRPDQSTFRRNVTHVRKAFGMKFSKVKQTKSFSDDDLDDIDAQVIIPPLANNIGIDASREAPPISERPRPKRTVNTPAYLRDYVVSRKGEM